MTRFSKALAKSADRRGDAEVLRPVMLRQRQLRCSDAVDVVRPAYVPLCVPDITAKFAHS